MFEDKIYTVSDSDFTKIVKTSKSINDVAKLLGFKFSPGKVSRRKIKDRIMSLGLELPKKKPDVVNTIKQSKYLDTNKIGRVGEKYFEFICAKHNISCLKEDTCCELYDYIIDINGKLYKIQVKTAEFKEDNKITTSFYISHGNFYNKKNSKKVYTTGDFDFYFLYCIESGDGFLCDIPKTSNDRIRVWDRIPNNGVTKNLVFADNIRAEKVLEDLKNK